MPTNYAERMALLTKTRDRRLRQSNDFKETFNIEEKKDLIKRCVQEGLDEENVRNLIDLGIYDNKVQRISETLLSQRLFYNPLLPQIQETKFDDEDEDEQIPSSATKTDQETI